MNVKRIARRTARVLFSILLIASILVFSLSMAVSQMFSANRVNARLFENGFYDRATQSLTEQLEDLQSVLGISPESVMEIVTPDQLQGMLAPYTDALTAQFLEGGPAPEETEYFSEELYELICDTITEEHYDGDIEQLTADRVDAYAELTAAVNNTVNFFPQSLMDKLLGDSIQQKLIPLYRAIGVARRLWLPAVAVLALCVVGLWLLRRRDSLSALRRIAGIGFITGAALFVPAFFIRSYSLPQRLSLSDGLLRRYILTVYSHMTNSLFFITLWVFVVATVLLVLTVILSAKSGGVSCTDRASVLE